MRMAESMKESGTTIIDMEGDMRDTQMGMFIMVSSKMEKRMGKAAMYGLSLEKFMMENGPRE